MVARATEEGMAGGRFRQREKGTSHAKAFRQWLVRTVGLCRLCQGSGVLDIAGGKGQLSFELLNLQAVPTTVVDPRPLNVVKYCESFRMGHYGRRPAGAAPQAPLHIQRFWEPKLWSPQAPACPVQRQLREAWERAHGKELQRSHRAEGPVEEQASDRNRDGAGKECHATARGDGAPPVASGKKKEKVKPRFRGVYFDDTAWEGKGGFAACIRAGGKRHDLGVFSTEEEAAAAYDTAALELLGADAHLNLAAAAGGRGGGTQRARPRGCWRCGPFTNNGDAKACSENEGKCVVGEVDTDGFSGWSQHKAFQCPHTQRGSAAGDRSEKAAAREGEVAVVVDSEEEIARIMANCSILVGLHPDQATGDLVDYALAHNKPFAVVPCCTFHEHFRDRFLPSGKPVKSYADLVQWILAKDSRILKDELPTGGRNIVLHFLCQSPDQGPGAGAGEAPGGESSAALV